MQKQVEQRSGGKCEVCGNDQNIEIITIGPHQGLGADELICICSTCKTQYEGTDEIQEAHWRCLNDAMWSDVPSVKVLSYRMLNRLKHLGWSQDLLDMFYADEELIQWANSGMVDESEPKHLDSNGILIQSGDTVTLIKDLEVKGAGFTAKRGTAVRNIRVVQDNHEHIEGKVNGQSIIILTKYVKK
jgi:protein PhnA